MLVPFISFLVIEFEDLIQPSGKMNCTHIAVRASDAISRRHTNSEFIVTIPCTHNSIFIVFLTVRNLDGILEPTHTYTHNEFYAAHIFWYSKGHKMCELIYIEYMALFISTSFFRQSKRKTQRERRRRTKKNHRLLPSEMGA